MNLILFLLLYISKYYENMIITIKYLSRSNLNNSIKRIEKLEELGHIKSEMVTYKNITWKIEWISYYKKYNYNKDEYNIEIKHLRNKYTDIEFCTLLRLKLEK